MRRLLLLVMAASLLGSACSSSSTTIETADIEEAVAQEQSGDSSVAAPDGDEPDQGDESGSDATTGSGSSDAEAADPTPTIDPGASDDDAEGDSSNGDVSGSGGAADGDTSTDDSTGEPAATPTTAAATGPTPTPNADATEAIQAVLDADDWCAAAQAVEDGTFILDTLDFTDPDELEAGFRQSAAVIAAAEPLAPPEYAADVAAVGDLFGQFAATLEDADWNIIAIDTVALQNFDGATDQAGYNIERYNFDVCGVGQDPGEPPVPGVLPDITGDFDLDNLPPGLIPEGALPAGLTQEQVLCLSEQFESVDESAIEQNPTLLFELLTTCGLFP